MEHVINRVLKAFELTADFYSFIPEAGLALAILGAPSNRIGEQAWCIVGARESYLAALKSGSWKGFSCSLQDCFDKRLILNKLEQTALDLIELVRTSTAEELNIGLLLALLEHEVQHHGQLIRYAYANRLGFPNSWSARYSV
ncbi:MAG: hypothetical protein KGZ50_00955 [Peptococcaceae bacterium]|nr:hypothetical protein [Peptococcaceae bacterium]